MKYGMPTLIENKNIEESAQLCKALGLNFIEINMNLPQYQAENIDINNFNEVANYYGISYTIHADENMNPFDFNQRISKAYFNTMLDTIRLAKGLSVPVINMHMPSGVYFTLPDKKIYLFDKFKEEFLTKIKEFIIIMEQTISKDNIKICVENGGTFEKFQIKAMEYLLESPIFYLTYDIGHAACNETEMRKFYNLQKEKLVHMHIHDAKLNNNGIWKNHLALGDGDLDLNYYFSLAENTNSRVVLETKTIAGLSQSVQWIELRNRLN